MFKGSRTYRFSVAELDVDIYVVDVEYRGAEYTKLKVLYWNRHYRAYIMPTPDKVKIMKNDDWKWEWIKNH